MASHYNYFKWLGLFALVAMFGSAFLLTKIAVEDIPPVMVTAGRIVIGAILLLLIAYAQGERLADLKGIWSLLLVLALTGNCLPFFVIAWGQQYVDSGLAGILMAMMPLTTVALAHFFVDTEKITKDKVAGFLLGFSGVVILMLPEFSAYSGFDWIRLIGMLSILGGAVSYALNSIVAYALPNISLCLISAGVLLMASVVIVPLSLLEGWRWIDNVSSSSLWAVGLLGIFPGGLATIVYFSVIRHAGPAFLSQINYLIPVWAVILGVVLAGEQLTIHALAALAVILTGIAIAQRSARAGSICRD